MDFEEIRYEIAGQVLTITLDRPDRLNAFTATMHASCSTPSTAPTPTTRCARWS